MTCNASEPPIGIESMTYALRGACCLPPHALPAPIARKIAVTALAALGLSTDPFHGPVPRLRPLRDAVLFSVRGKTRQLGMTLCHEQPAAS